MATIKYAVGVDFKAKGNLAKQVDKMRQKTDHFRNAAERANKVFGGMGKNVRLVGAILTSKVISRTFAIAEDGVRGIASAFVEMDQALVGAAAKFGDVEKGSEKWKVMEESVRNIGQTTKFTSAEAAQGLDFLAMAGFNYAQSVKMLPGLTQLAVASNMDLARTSDIASDALGAFSLSRDDDEIGKSMQRVNDVFAKTVTSTNTTMETLFNTMAMSGAAVENAGGDIETWAALTGTLGSAGIKGTVAATALKNMYLNLASPAAQGAKALKRLGINVADSKGDMRDMLDILDDVKKATDNLGSQKRSSLFKIIFGKRAITGVSSLLKGGIDRVRDLRKELFYADGAAAELAKKMGEGLANKIKKLESAVTEKGFQVIEKMLGGKDPGEAIDIMIKKIRKFDVTALAKSLKQVLETMASIAKWMYEWRTELKYALEAYISISVVVKGIQLVNLARDLKAAVGAMSELPLIAKGLNNISNVTERAQLYGDTIIGGSPAGKATLGNTSAASLMKYGGVAGIATVVVGVLGAAAVGAAIGSLIWSWREKYENRNATIKNKFTHLTGARVTDKVLRNTGSEQLEKRKAEINRLYNSYRGEGRTAMDAYRREALARIDRELQVRWMEKQAANDKGVSDAFEPAWARNNFRAAARKDAEIHQSIITKVIIENAPPGTTAKAVTKAAAKVTDFEDLDAATVNMQTNAVVPIVG